MKRGVLIFLFFITLLPLASATNVLTDIYGYWPLDSTSIKDRLGSAGDGTNQGGVSKSYGAINYSLAYDGATQYTDMNFNSFNTSGFTYTLWVNASSTDTNDNILADGNRDMVLRTTTGCSAQTFCWNLWNGSAYSTVESPSYSTNTWYFLTLRFNQSGDRMSMWVNGVKQDSASINHFYTNGAQPVRIATHSGAGLFFPGMIDNVGIWQRPLNNSEILCMYEKKVNYNNITTCNAAAPPATVNFSVTAIDSYDSTSLSNFSIVMVNSTALVNFSTETGQINTSVSPGAGLFNITFFSNDSGGYFSRTYVDYNVSADLIASLHQSEVTFLAFNRVSGASVTNFTALVNQHGGSESNTAINPVLNLTSENGYQARFFKNGYFQVNSSLFNTTPLSVQNVSFSVYDHLLNLTLQITGETDTTSNFSVDIYDLQGWGYHRRLSTTSGFITANLTDGNYTVWLNDSVHVLTAYNITLNGTTGRNVTNYTMVAANINQLRLSFFDLDTLLLIQPQQVNVTLVGTFGTFTDSTTNGTAILDLLNPDTYEVTATASNYSDATIFVTLNNDNATVDMYLDPATLTSITFNVESTLAESLSNATITITRNVNGTIVTVAQAKTDAFGQAVIDLDQTADYLITVTAAGFNTFEGTFKPIDTEYTISLEPQDSDPYISFFDLAQLDGPTFTYSNITQTLTITLDAVSASGAIDWFGMNTSYNSVKYSQNVTGSAGGGTVQFVINPANVSIQDQVNVRYFLRVNGYNAYVDYSTFYISDATPTNNTLAGGLFRSPVNDLGPAGLAILGTLIVLGAFGFVFSLGAGFTPAAISAALVTGALGWAGLFSVTYAVIVVILTLMTSLGDTVT